VVEDPAVARAAALAALGHAGALTDDERAQLGDALGDDDGRVRAAALGAILRADPSIAFIHWHFCFDDPDARVRRRAADLAATLAPSPDIATKLVGLLGDADVTVVEAAAFALGELGAAAIQAGAVPALAATTTGHRDPIAREAAVAALGALGDEAGLAAVLVACRDKPTVRRRAVLALAPFDGEEVDAALRAALDDKDWQVRQAAEDLLGE